MQLSEQAIERGLVGPTKRLIALSMVIYFSAALHPIIPSILSAVEGPRRVAIGQTWERGDFEMIRWDVFPPFEALSSSMVIVYAPTFIFCLICSVLDRSEAWRINILAGMGTFFLYVLDDRYFWIGPIFKISGLFAIVMLTICILFGDSVRRSTRQPD